MNKLMHTHPLGCNIEIRYAFVITGKIIVTFREGQDSSSFFCNRMLTRNFKINCLIGDR